jgi:hypothetical protein
MLCIGKLDKRCRWNIIFDELAGDKERGLYRDRKAIRAVEMIKAITPKAFYAITKKNEYRESWDYQRGGYANYPVLRTRMRVMRVPVFRVRLKANYQSGNGKMVFDIVGGPEGADKLLLARDSVAKLFDRMACDPRTYVRGDGFIRVDVKLCKYGDSVYFALLEDDDQVVSIEGRLSA